MIGAGTWSWTRWGVIGGLALGAQLLGIHYLGRPPRSPSVEVCADACLAFVPASATDIRVEWAPNPARFALPDPHGFSGSADRWKPRAPEPSAIPVGPAIVLSGASDGVVLGAVPEPPGISPIPRSRKTSPLEGYHSPPLVADSTQVFFDKRLQERSPTNIANVPVWRGQQLPSRTRIEVMVDPWGAVAGLHLLESSGSREMDNLGLESVRQWRFRPAYGGDFAKPFDPANLARGAVTLNWAPGPPENR